MPARKNKEIETLNGVADGVINKGQARKADKYKWQVIASTAPSKLEIHGMARFPIGWEWVMCHAIQSILGPAYTRWATPGLDRLMHCSLFEISVAQAEFSARGPVRLQHNENFKRKHGMSRASPADRGRFISNKQARGPLSHIELHKSRIQGGGNRRIPLISIKFGTYELRLMTRV